MITKQQDKIHISIILCYFLIHTKKKNNFEQKNKIVEQLFVIYTFRLALYCVLNR